MNKTYIALFGMAIISFNIISKVSLKVMNITTTQRIVNHETTGIRPSGGRRNNQIMNTVLITT